MGKSTNIEYVDSTINPIRGCNGCELWTKTVKTCYAGRLVEKFKFSNNWPTEFTKPLHLPDELKKSLAWSDLTGTDRPNKPWLNGYPRIIFVNDMSDSWTEFVWKNGERSAWSIDWLLPYMDDLTSSPHIYLFLTKRASKAVKFLRDVWGEVPSNFWVGTSVTSGNTRGRANELAKLRRICNGKLWLSLEPLYFDVDILNSAGFDLSAYDWIVVGGESGPSPAKTNIDTIGSLIEDCEYGNVPLFVKQLGSQQGYGPKGGDWEQWPKELQVRQMPEIETYTQAQLF